MSNYIIHFGIKRKSGRYPWGSGKRPHQSEEKGDSRKESSSQNEEKTKDKKKEKFHLSDKQKTAIKIGLGVAGAALAAYGGYKLYNNVLKDAIDKGRLNHKLSKIAKNIKKETLEKERAFVANVNRESKAKYGSTGNCMHCSLATALHMMNPEKYKNVTAKPMFNVDEKSGYVIGGRSPLTPSAFFNNVKTQKFSKPTRMRDLSKYIKPNSFGTVQVSYNVWGQQGGHILNYKKDGNKLIFIESQTGKILDNVFNQNSNYLFLYNVNQINDFTNAYPREDMKKDLFKYMVNLNK